MRNGHCYRIEYAKKKDKKAVIKVMKDETVKKDDLYKSHTIHVASGEPSSSVSRPPAKRKPGVVRPITQGKLLRKGGPSDSVRIMTLSFESDFDKDSRSRNPLQDRSLLPNLYRGNLRLLQLQSLFLHRSLLRLQRLLVVRGVCLHHLVEQQFRHRHRRRHHHHLLRNQKWTHIVPSLILRAKRVRCR